MPLLRSPRGTAVLLLAAVLITFGLLQIGQQTIAMVYTGIGLFLFYYTTRLVLQIRMVQRSPTPDPSKGLHQAPV